MKVVVGFLGGLVLGAVGAVAYSMQTGRDLRAVVDEVRSDLSRRDLDALGVRLEGRVTEMQRELEVRIAQVREKAAAVAEAPAVESVAEAPAVESVAEGAVVAEVPAAAGAVAEDAPGS